MSGQAIKPEYLTPGTTVGAYEIVEQVASGGFGYVYRVRRDGRIYALKIGRARLSALAPDERASSVERLEREIAALTSLHHRNIVRVHSFERWPDLEGGYPYLVMDFVAGLPLQDWRTGATPALDRIVAVFERIAGALDHMHELGIIHRDLKSQNILVNTEGEPFIVDFGIARPRVARDLTQAAGIGTLTHLTPEYVVFLDSEDARKGVQFDWRPATDLYALGYVLYEALTGVPPVPRFSEGTAKEESVLMSAIKTSAPRHPREILPRIPQALDDLVMQLLEKDPLKRPHGAAAVAARLREAREAGKAAGDSVWTQPFDLPGDVRPGRTAEDGPPVPPEVDAGEHVPGIEEGDQPHEATEGPAATEAAEVHSGTNFSPPTTEFATAFDEGGEAGEAKPAPADDRWSRESQLIKRAAGAWAAATPRPRRWPFAVAIAAGGAVIVIIMFMASSGTEDRPGPKTLLSSVEAGASPAASTLSAPPVDPSLSPPVQQPAPTAADRTAPESSLRAIPLGEVRRDAKALPQHQDQAGLVRSRPLGPEPQVLLPRRPDDVVGPDLDQAA